VATFKKLFRHLLGACGTRTMWLPISCPDTSLAQKKIKKKRKKKKRKEDPLMRTNNNKI